AADVVEELPTEEAEKILELMQEEKSEEVQEILEYPEHSAGRLMSPDFVAVNEGSTVEQAIEHIRKSVSEERAFEVYVVDSHRHLVGVVPLRRLLTAHPSSPVFAIRDDNVVSVTPEMDQEEVARLVAKYDLVAVPVVDRDHRLVGPIAVDDVLDTVGEEASEDVFGIVVGVIGTLWHSPAFGFIVAVSMFISVNFSGVAGTTIPMLSKRLGFDPALTAGPFETALQDVLGVTIFLSLATALLRWLT